MHGADPGGAQGSEQGSHSVPAYGVTGLNCESRLQRFLASTVEELLESGCLLPLLLSFYPVLLLFLFLFFVLR